MNTTNHLPINSDEIFSDLASIDIFMKVADYFDVDYDSVFSVYNKTPNHLEGEVALFTRREVFVFEMLEIAGVLCLTKLEAVSIC